MAGTGWTLALWYADRGSAVVLYPALWAAVATGAARRLPVLPVLRDASRRHHVTVSVFAVLVGLIHGVLGTVDTAVILDGAAPMPAYGPTVLLGGVAVGAVGALLTGIAVLGFLDPRRFDRPVVVHALAYLGFGVGTLHALLVGTDVTELVVQGVLGLLLAVAFLLAVRVLDGVRVGASAS